MDGTVSTDRFSTGQEQAELRKKQLPGRASASGLAGKRGFFANLPANRGFGRGRCDMAAFGGRFVLHVFGTDPVEHREAILRKKGRLNALRAAFLARLSAREAFRFLRYVSAGAAATLFLRRSSHGLYFASQSCIALPPPAFPRSVSILSCPSVLCLRTSNLSGLECFLLRSEQLVQHTFRCLQKAFGQKVRLCLSGRAFFRCPVRSKQKFRRSDTPEAAGNGWR